MGGSGGAHPTLGGAARMLTTLARQVSLPVHTRLSFNDSGRITHHQDIWDVKDVLGLIPGVGIAQWIGSRVLAHGLASAFDVYEWASSSAPRDGVKKEGDETPRGGGSLYTSGAPGSDTPGVDAYATGSIGRAAGASSGSQAAANALGLQLSDRLSNVKSRAPDTDYDV